MYAGHAAIALVLRSRYPDVAILPLAAACYGPDLLEAALMIPTPRAGMAVYTHSIPALVIGALVAAGAYALFAKRRSDALALFVGWMLHWPADFFTGLKPIVGLQPRVGLDLYHLPIADFALETLCVVAACAVYARRFAPTGRERRLVVALAGTLIVLQAGIVWTLAITDRSGWNPSLALARSRTHLASSSNPACLLHAHTATFDSERGMDANGDARVVTLVCLTCGKEQFFTQNVPASATCHQCGGSVFRTFETPTQPDEAAIDALEAQARSMAYGDSSPETTRDDVRDLDLL